jgi:hypothetical protein
MPRIINAEPANSIGPIAPQIRSIFTDDRSQLKLTNTTVLHLYRPKSAAPLPAHVFPSTRFEIPPNTVFMAVFRVTLFFVTAKERDIIIIIIIIKINLSLMMLLKCIHLRNSITFGRYAVILLYSSYICNDYLQKEFLFTRMISYKYKLHNVLFPIE